MIPPSLPNGNLPPGIHEATWQEVAHCFGTNPHRQALLDGLFQARQNLKHAGCAKVYLNGSFVTYKEHPGDFDAAWETCGVNPDLLHPALRDFSNSRRAQKQTYRGELFYADAAADEHGRTFIEFFQTDRERNPKGIVAIDLRTLP